MWLMAWLEVASTYRMKRETNLVLLLVRIQPLAPLNTDSQRRREVREISIDLTRCKYCKKRPRGKLAIANFDVYAPYCSYHCQETDNMQNALNYVRGLKRS